MRRTAIIAGSVIAVLATGGVIAASGGAQGPAPQGTVIKLVSEVATFKLVDVPPRVGKKGKIGTGDELVLSAPLTNAASKRAGTLDVHCSLTKTAPKMRGVCDGIYTLADGELHLLARLSQADDLKGSVVGGTGAYVGVRGTFASVAGSGTKGGERRDETITLLP